MPGVSWRFKTPSHCLQYNPKCFLLGRQDDGFPTRTFQILRQSYLAVCLDFVVSGRGSTATRFRGCCAIRMRTCRTRTQLRSNCTTGMLTPSSTRQQKPRLKMGCHYLAFKFNLGSYNNFFLSRHCRHAICCWSGTGRWQQNELDQVLGLKHLMRLARLEQV